MVSRLERVSSWSLYDLFTVNIILQFGGNSQGTTALYAEEYAHSDTIKASNNLGRLFEVIVTDFERVSVARLSEMEEA